MKAEFYLIVGAKKNPYYNPKATYGMEKYGLADVQVRRSKPPTKAHQIAVKVELNIPDRLFEKPVLSVKAHIKDFGESMVLDADVQDQLAQIIKDQTGLAVTISASGEE